MEKITIKNFGPIEEAEIEIRKVLVLIGEQASGKSTIAKLIYFFKTIGDEFYHNFKWDIDFDITKIDEMLQSSIGGYFIRLFNSLAVEISDLSVEMTYATGLQIRIRRPSLGNFGIQVAVSTLAYYEAISDLLPLFNDVKSLNNQLINESTQNIRDTIRGTISEIRTEIRKKLISFFGGSFDSRLFVPAAREEAIDKSTGLGNAILEYPNPSSLPYHFESSDEILLSIYKKIIDFEVRSLQRVQQIEMLPLHFKTTNSGSDSDLLYQEFLDRYSKILKGNLIADRYGLNISLEKNGKMIKMPDASSGQKSTSPIILDLAYSLASQEKVFRVIEEPESHLFPTAQKQLIELLVFLANAQPESQVIITTHSPYVLTSVNNMLMAYHAALKSPENEAEVSEIYPQNFRIHPDDFSAYSLGNTAFEPADDEEQEDFCVSIFDRRIGLIDQNYLDTVSEILAYEFQFLMQRYSNPKVSHDA